MAHGLRYGLLCHRVHERRRQSARYFPVRCRGGSFFSRQADLLLVCGTISYKQAPILKRIYEQMPQPKWVVSMGACAGSGGMYDNYCTVQGIDSIIPVDCYISGCPPRPEAVLDALMNIQEQVRSDSVLRERHQDFKGILDTP